MILVKNGPVFPKCIPGGNESMQRKQLQLEHVMSPKKAAVRYPISECGKATELKIAHFYFKVVFLNERQIIVLVHTIPTKPRKQTYMNSAEAKEGYKIETES